MYACCLLLQKFDEVIFHVCFLVKASFENVEMPMALLFVIR